MANTTMGLHFYGSRVHCGAVRLKRGHILPFRLSISSPNSVHVWGNFNCPGYKHHGRANLTNVDYTVPERREWVNVAVERDALPASIYADSITAYETSWIHFDMSDSSKDDLTDGDYGNLVTSDPRQNRDARISYDHKLWWEDDGMRRENDLNDKSYNSLDPDV